MSNGAKLHSYAEHIMDLLDVSRTTWSGLNVHQEFWNGILRKSLIHADHSPGGASGASVLFMKGMNGAF